MKSNLETRLERLRKRKINTGVRIITQLTADTFKYKGKKITRKELDKMRADKAGKILIDDISFMLRKKGLNS
jgi:hypothetical protein